MFIFGLDCKNDYYRVMKLLSRLLLLCLLGWGPVLAQGNLPACKGPVNKWSECLGTEVFPSGDKYIGEFKSGRFSGRGEYYFLAPNERKGNIFVGEFKDGMYNGLGIEYDKNGKIISSGKWKNSQLEEQHAINSSLFSTSTINFTGQEGVSPIDSAVNKQSSYREIKTSHILVESGAEAAYLYQEIKVSQGNKVAKFRELANRFSKDPGSGKNGGQLGWAAKGSYVAEYEKVANELNIGEISMPFKTQFGWHLMYLEDKFELTQLPAISNNQQATASQLPNTFKRDQLNAEIEVENKKRQDLEDQLRVSQQLSTKPAASYAIERRVALVIGNATYKVNPLKNPVNDSTDMARSLRSVGFDVIEANNTTLAQMREVTRRFADKLGNSDVGLVYYSGHGVEVKGKNYLIPVNADIKREYEVVDQAFDASQFLEMMDNIRGPNNKRVNILIVDACRNNELQKSWRSTNNGLARMDAPGGTFISFATAPGRVAADGTGRNSPYTKHLLQALKQPNVPIEQVFKVVRRNVMEETKGEQIPWENSSLVGDFYFTVQR